MDPVAAPRGSLEPPPSPPLCPIPQTIVKRSGNDSARNNLPANECLKRNCSIADGSFINFDRRYLIEAARRGEARRGAFMLSDRYGRERVGIPMHRRKFIRWTCFVNFISVVV